MFFGYGGQRSLVLDRRAVTQQQPTIPRCRQLLWPVATGDVSSPATADEMALNRSRKYVITEEFVNFHMLCVGEITTCLNSFGRSSPFAPHFKVLTYRDLQRSGI